MVSRKDGDLIFLTDNPVLLNNIIPSPTIFCIQRKAEKKVVTEDDLVEANIMSFGDDIGKTTNYITAMYDVQSKFEPGSVEYESLAYRIRCGQLFQQNCIDRAKGVVCKPMPRYWHDAYSASRLPDNPTEEDVERRDLNLRIVAELKPYFMRYIYEEVKRQHNSYVKNTEVKAMTIYGKGINELLDTDRDSLTEDEAKFIAYYKKRMPLNMNNCVMNRICRMVETEFDNKPIATKESDSYDYAILRGNTVVLPYQKSSIKKLYKRHLNLVKDFMAARHKKFKLALNNDWYFNAMFNIRRLFVDDCLSVCSNLSQTCDALLDICYKGNGSKQLVWDMYSKEIVSNLLKKNDYTLSFPSPDPDGDIIYCGNTFSMTTIRSKQWEKSY